jgi:hypothetical protein
MQEPFLHQPTEFQGPIVGKGSGYVIFRNLPCVRDLLDHREWWSVRINDLECDVLAGKLEYVAIAVLPSKNDSLIG